MTTTIESKSYTREMKHSFYDYAMTTITNRALPDVRDGLKPVHRRIVFGMNQLKMYHNKPHKKSARIVGDILGKYHPHGDSSVYEAMVRLSQDFSLMIPLVDGHGNFGSVDGDSAAAMRYTEARLSQAGETMALDLEKNVVSFAPNYDDSETEPVVLPARFPNLIVNGSEGIATGMATKIPTHNPKEVADAWRYMIQYEGKVKEATLLNKLSAPDFPMGGVIVNEEEVRSFYTTGYGKVTMRGKYRIEDVKGRTKRIVFTELPDKAIGSKNQLINQLIEYVNDKTLNEVVDVIDESNREGIRLVLDVKKDTNIERFMNKLWLKTNLQSTDRMQFLVLVNGKPETITLQRYFEEYIAYQKELHLNRQTYLLGEVNRRLEIVDGFLKAHEVMDVLIDAIRHADSHESILACLTKGETQAIDWRLKKHAKIAQRFDFSKRQAEAILNRRLRTLTNLDALELQKEHKKLNKQKTFHESVLSDEAVLKQELLNDVDAFRSLYACDRRTEVTTKATDTAVLEEKVSEPVGVIVDEHGYIQARPNVSGTSLDLMLREDTDTTDTVAVFTTQGSLYHIKMEDVPADKKIPIQVLTGMQPGERLVHVGLGSQLDESTYFVLTHQGKAKQLSGQDLVTKGFRSKTFYTKVDAKRKDEVMICTPIAPEQWLVVKTDQERGGRIDVTHPDVPFKPYGKTAKGSTIVKLKKGETIIAARLPEKLSDDAFGQATKQYKDITNKVVKPL